MGFDAYRCENGHATFPEHPRCPECYEPQNEVIDLSERTGEVITWTKSTATPPGVRQPNMLAIVEFNVDGETVRALGGLKTEDIEMGDTVKPVYVEEVREPGAGIKPEAVDQEWDGYRFKPVS